MAALWHSVWAAEGETLARTRRHPFFAVERALADLDAQHAEPFVARLDDAFAWERSA